MYRKAYFDSEVTGALHNEFLHHRATDAVVVLLRHANGTAATTLLSNIVSSEIVTLQNHTPINKTPSGTSVIVTCDRVNHASLPEPTPDTTVCSPAPSHAPTRRIYRTSCLDTLHGKPRHFRSSRVLPCSGAASASNAIFAV